MEAGVLLGVAVMGGGVGLDGLRDTDDGIGGFRYILVDAAAHGGCTNLILALTSFLSESDLI